ncbi:MAG TPA: hypothetical protein VLM40_09020 [Gemmata sp.]|nr:hypothetical protein [Gemmata sp.]
MAGLLGIGIFLLAVVVLLLTGATFFRAAVALANKTIGPVKPNASIAWDWEAADDDEEFDEINRKLRAIPEPGLGQGVLVMLVVGVVQVLIAFVLEGVFGLERARRRGDEEGWVLGHLVGIAIGFAVLTGMTASMLPTTGKRAALVAFFFYLVSIAVIAFVVGLIYLVLSSVG